MDKQRVLSKIEGKRIVAVVRGKSKEDALEISEACIAGGITIIEVAFTTPNAQVVIRELASKYADNADVVIGAGTVLDDITARIAILEGAKFVVSPAIDIDTIRLCNRYQIPCMPGTTTLTGVIEALEAGADIIKLFPGEIVGVNMLKAIHGPLPAARLMPTGGVSVDNVKEWLAVGAVAVGVGGSLTKGTPAEITAKARLFTQAIS